VADTPDDIRGGKPDGRVPDRTAELASVNTKLRQEVEEKTRAENLLRQLNQRVVQSQDEERRRIARELHDSVGQELAALTMSVTMLGSRIPDEFRPDVEDILSQIHGCIKDVPISHLLHPPLLDEGGLSSALSWYVGEFSRRGGIHVDLDMPPELERMKSEVETAIFRIVQESLTNIHRHSGARKARISIGRGDGTVRMSISDDGRGISKEKLKRIAAGQSGVGVAGMRERVKQLGGTFQIRSNGPGTTLDVELPFTE
jgi:two-component system, NarL family, sensor kinase